MSVSDGVSIFIGSMAGHFVGAGGVFVGAIIGGILGICASVWIAARILGSVSYKAAVLVGVDGFIVAAIIAVKNLHEPLISIACVSFIGIGAILGNMLNRRMPLVMR